ncbi:uncharacterized protein LOC124150105 [Haliotis rufescens]|uniref:uncharacterized protein LOC124150105 n=1 Tax=Haliotis rufescens TaxID=6454 RepID=UPI00201F4E1C|nr:uncharacterized protein LOC124150105 [Haliotis rufescens]
MKGLKMACAMCCCGSGDRVRFDDQEYVSLEFLLEKYDMLAIGNDERQELRSELERHTSKYEAEAGEEDVLAAFSLLRKGVCRPDFPGQYTTQFFVVQDVLAYLMTLSKNLRDSGKITSLSRIHDFCFDFLHDLIQQGPGTTHMQLWTKMLSDRDFGFKVYYWSLTGSKLKKHILFLKREYRSQEQGTGWDGFKSTFDACMKQLIDKQNLSGRAFAEAQAEFIELYLHAHLGFTSREKEVREVHDQLALLICNNYDYRNVYVGLKDPEQLKHFLKQIEDIICQTNLTTEDCEAVVKRLHDVVKMLLTVIKHGHIDLSVYRDILDFVAVICDTKAGSPIHSIVEAVGRFYYSVRPLQGNSEMFTVMTTKLIDFLTNLEDHTLMRVHYVDYAIHPVLSNAMGETLTPAHCRLTIDLIKACIRIYQPRTIEAAKKMMYESQDKMQWKDHLKDACDLFDLLTQVQVIGDDKQTREYCSNFSELTDHFGYLLEREQVLPKMIAKMADFSLTLLEKREPKLFKAASDTAHRIEFKGRYHKGVIISTMARVLPLLEDPRFDWNDDASSTVKDLAGVGMDTLASKSPDEKEFIVLIKFFRAVLKDGLVGENPKEKESMRYHLFYEQGSTFVRLLDDPRKIQRAMPVVRQLISLMSHESPSIADQAMWQVQNLVNHGTKVMTQFFPQILTACINTDNYSLIDPLASLYPHSPNLLESQFEAVFSFIDTNYRHQALLWLHKIAKKQSILFKERHFERLIDDLLQADDDNQNSYLHIMDPLSTEMPLRFIPYLKTLMDMEPDSATGAWYSLLQVLTNVAVSSKDEALCERMMAFLEKKIRGPEVHGVTVCYLLGMRNVGQVHRHVLESRKPALEDLRERSTVVTTKDHCTYIIDVLEGKAESLAEDIKEVKEDVEKLDVRVTNTEEGLVQVNQELGQQKGELDEVKHEVKEQVEKMGQLEETVDDTKAKVEELDEKTLSHAPIWSRDVARLLNPEGFLDWTNLSSRLGYTNDDIRSWAQMHDPCMAMLNEWYATRKTREATFAVLTALQEIDRMDAAVIVENAMKMSEAVVEDEEFEYPEPPEVFLSYQWGIQNEVKLLKLHLEKAGFTCWMDIGQMGGGDKLFEKIDKGIRAAKIIICCVTEKYTKSPNGIREVNLSVSLGKPIIPLLMEKLSWPPPGSMGPIFSEYLFIRFFTRPGEETGDVRYWSAAKFQELLMQVNYNNVKQDEKKVGKEYKNWWCPVAEVIKIEKKDVKAMTAASQKTQQNVESGAASPDVFISYQWGKQKQIQLLYKRLTEMGFTVWMDIYQMGGGDSLYDKIDKGVRGAKVVLSCVTSKYSLSANCRREISLADALKKPIVPLLLEKMTWPPSGPMSMVFTQLLYINFTKDKSVQDLWSGKKFNELLIKLNQYVPDIILFGKEDEETEVNASPNPEETPAVGDTLDTTPQSQDNTTTMAEQMPDVSD